MAKKRNIKKALSDAVLLLRNKMGRQPFNYKQISSLLNINDQPTKQLMNTILQELIKSKDIIEIKRGKFQFAGSSLYLTGHVDMTKSGAAYVIVEGSEEDIYIAPKNTHNALHGDKVKVLLHAKKKHQKSKGEIASIISRAKHDFVGIVKVSSRFAFLIPDDNNIHIDLYIPLSHLNGAKDGEKAIGQITEWPEGATNPFGKIIEVFGKPGEHAVEMNAIIYEFDLPLRFPEEVIKESESIPVEINPSIAEKRKDFRKVTTFTIDPCDAKDFDDALSIQQLPNGNYEIGVHIADVSHYIQTGNPLDKEAYKRATSVYLVDRVIPMLPEKLSNEICSLRPDEDKLCFSAVFEMNKKAMIVSYHFEKTIIRSDRRFTYEEVQDIIQAENTSRPPSAAPYAEEIHTLHHLAQTLRTQRIQNGSVAFETIEVKFTLDEQGNPTSVYFREHLAAHQLIEEFMLLANKSVAEFVGKKSANKTFVYRVHDVPPADRMETFSQFVRKFGYSFNTHSRQTLSSSMNQLLHQIKGKKEENMIGHLAVRTMAKAIYTTKNIGHYGLGFDYYTHFTSPIRRYPDLMVHRLLSHYLNGGKSVKADTCEDGCKHASAKERKAEEAERTSVKFKQTQYLANKIGMAMEGIISGVTEWGIYVEITENKCEGMIRLRDLHDDHYMLDEDNYCVTGRKYKHKYQLGAKVKVEIKEVDIIKRQVDMVLIENGYL